MKILAIADEPDKRLWDYLDRRLLEDVDLILSCGDLPADYLGFISCFTKAPILYVHGNHDTKLLANPPGGCDCIDGDLVVINGIRILGLGGSMRYKGGECMYNEKEMSKRIRKLWFKLFKYKGFDILLAHAPARDHGDQSDLAHWGFRCFLKLIDKYHPKYLIHGHIHQSYNPNFKRETEYNGTRIINAYQKVYIDI